MNQTLSKSISLLRFPLAALIVLKHYYTPDISAAAIGGVDEYQWYHYIGEFTKGVFPAIAVPLFFFISGYLYFNKLDLHGDSSYDFNVWKMKTRGRLKSLLIPYISWNLLVLLLYFIAQQLTSNSTVMAKDGYKLIVDYNLLDYGKAFFAIDSTGMPIDGPLWFIRDLFIVSVFITPWKSHATLTLLAKQDLPTFGYNMIAPLKSWCWGSILFYPFKISRFS